MQKKLHIKILEFLNGQKDIISYVSLTDLIVDHYISLKGGEIVVGHHLSTELSSALNSLEKRGYIKLERIPNLQFEDSSVLTKNTFKTLIANAKIEIDGVNYLQSEQDAQVTREFIISQKEYLVEQSIQINIQTKLAEQQTNIIRRQSNILIGALLVSILSLVISGISVYQSSKDGVETQLKELVKSQQNSQLLLKEKLKSLTIQPVQTLTPKPSKTSSKK